MNASCQQENGKFETDCFQILSPDKSQLCNVMLLVDWLQVNVFLKFEHTKEWHSFYVYMTTSVSAYDIIQITLNDYNSRY